MFNQLANLGTLQLALLAVPSIGLVAGNLMVSDRRPSLINQLLSCQPVAIPASFTPDKIIAAG